MSQMGKFISVASLGGVITVTGNAGGAITPDGVGNINIVGSGNITITGNPATWTLTSTLSGTTDHAVQVGNATGSLTSLGVGLTAQVLKGNTAADPSWGSVDLTTDVSGILPVGSGGIGVGTLLIHGVLVGNTTGAVSVTAVGATNEVLLGNTGADPSWGTVGNAALTNSSVTLTSGANITVTGSPLSLGGAATIAVSGTTDHTVQIGNATGSLTSLAAALNGQLIVGSTGADPVVASLTSTGGTLVVTAGAGTLNIDTTGALQTDTGFEAWSGGAPYFDDTVLGDFTLSQAGTGYIKGVPITWTAPQTVSGMTAGNCYWIYIDNTGTIGKTSTRTDSLYEDNIVLFECMRDSTTGTNLQVTVKENHPFSFPPTSSNWAHAVVGAVIENNEGGANIVLNGTQKIQINGDDELADHGLYTDIPDSAGNAVVWNKYYTTGAGKWARYNQNDTFLGVYNNAGTPTALGASKFGVYKLYASKDNINALTPVYFAVLHTAQFNNLVAAQTAIGTGTIASESGELASLELVRLGYIIYSEAAATIVDVMIDKQTLSSGSTSSGTNQASLVLTSTTNFDHILSAADTNVQAALETLDDIPVNGITGMVSLDFANAGRIGTSLVAGNTLLLQAYDTDLTGYVTFATLTANNTPTMDLADDVTKAGGYIYRAGGTDIPVADGGTGASTLTSHGVLYGAGTSAVTALAEASDGQLIIGSTGNAPVLATITAGTNVSIANAAGSITVSVPGAIVNWQVITADLNPMVVGNGYICNKAGLLALTLPSTAAVGTVLRITGINTDLGWTIAQGAGQQIHFAGGISTTAGAGGSVSSVLKRDCIELVCVVVDTEWNCVSMSGNVTIV